MKRTISLILSLFLLFSLTACTIPVTDPTTAPTTTAIVPTTTATEPQPTTEPVDTPKKLTIMVCNTGNSSGFDFNRREESNVWLALKKMLGDRGLEVEWIVVEESDYEAALADVLTGKAEVMPDAVWLGDAPVSQKVSAIEAGTLTPLDDILPYSDGTATEFFDAFPEYRAANAYDNKLWWFGRYEYPIYEGKTLSQKEGTLSGLTVRLDWLDILQMEVPQTVEELEAYLSACQNQNVNRDSEKGEYLISNFLDITNTGLNNLYGVPNHHFAVNLQTGTVNTPWTVPETKEMLKTLLRWLEEGYIDEECIGMDSTVSWRQTNQEAAKNQLFPYNFYRNNIDLPADYGYEPQQIGIIPDTSVHPNAYISRLPVGTRQHADMAFTSSLSSKRAAAELLDLLFSEEFETLMELGTEGDTYVVVNGKKMVISGGCCPVWPPKDHMHITTGEVFLSRGILPWIRRPWDLMSEETPCFSDYTGRVFKAYQDAKRLPVIYCTNSQNFLAVPTPEESNVIDVYEDAFIALSQSIFQSILRGEIDIDTQWESHVLEPLREAGMDILTEVYQARADRALG